MSSDGSGQYLKLQEKGAWISQWSLVVIRVISASEVSD